MPKLAYTPEHNTETHDAYVLRVKNHDTIRVWVDKQSLAILVSDLSGTELKPTRGVAYTTSDGNGGNRISSDSVRSYVLARDAMMVATVFTDINFDVDGPHKTVHVPHYAMASNHSGPASAWPTAEYPHYDLGDDYYADPDTDGDDE